MVADGPAGATAPQQQPETAAARCPADERGSTSDDIARAARMTQPSRGQDAARGNAVRRWEAVRATWRATIGRVRTAQRSRRRRLRRGRHLGSRAEAVWRPTRTRIPPPRTSRSDRGNAGGPPARAIRRSTGRARDGGAVPPTPSPPSALGRRRPAQCRARPDGERARSSARLPGRRSPAARPRRTLSVADGCGPRNNCSKRAATGWSLATRPSRCLPRPRAVAVGPPHRQGLSSAAARGR
jgi:hypothetical protein